MTLWKKCEIEKKRFLKIRNHEVSNTVHELVIIEKGFL